MKSTISVPETVILRMSGVSLIARGPSGNPITAYHVVEPDHLKRFSHFSCHHPLTEAVDYFLKRANAQYFRQAAVTP